MKTAKRLTALVRKEMIQLLRDRRTLAMLLLLPLIELFLFAYAVDMTVDHIPTAVADMSLDGRSRALVDALVASGYFDVALHVESEEEVIRAIDEGRARAGLVIPPGFAAQVERGGAQVLVVLDGSDSFTVQSGYSAASAVAQAHATELLVEKVSRMGYSIGTAPIVSSTRVLYNPDMDDLTFVMPGLAAMLLQLLTISLTAMSVVREREVGTIEQILVTPARPMELMVAKMVPNVFVACLALLSVTVAGVLWFGVPFRGSPWLFAWLSLLFIVSGLGMGLLISTVAQTQRQAQQILAMLMILSLMLTGFIYPRAPMPAAVRAVGNLIPMTYFVRIARGVISKGVGLSFLWSDVIALVLYGGGIMVLAAVTFKRRLD